MSNQFTYPKVALPEHQTTPLPLLWLQRVGFIAIALGFVALLFLTVKIYHEAPPIPDRVTGPDGSILFTGDDIRNGQQVFLKYGLLDSGTIWGRGGKRSRDFATEHQNTLAYPEAHTELKQNRYDPKTRVLTVGPAYGDWYRQQSKVWKERFSQPVKNGEPITGAIGDAGELNQLSAFVAWTAWASDANQAAPPPVHAYTRIDP